MDHELSDKELAFATSYIRHYRKGQAARDAGYEGPNYDQQGWNVYNRDHVKSYIKELIEQNLVSASETQKLISDTSRGNMTDYMKPVKKWITPTVKKGLQQLIDETRTYIEMEDEFCSLKGLTEDDYDKFQENLDIYRDRILKYQIELKHNPDAFRLVDGIPDEVEVIELDLAAIVADKERGIVKSYKVTKDGIQVDMCDPDISKERMAKIHGLYEKDNAQAANLILTHKEHKRTVENYADKFEQEKPGEGI